jgi:chromosome segregation ATPase
MPQFKQIKIFLLLAVIFGTASCATRGTVNSWEDAALIAEQRSEIERLSRDIKELQSQLGDAQQITQSSIESIDRTYARLESSLAGATSLQDSINALAEFARQCLEEINRLREYQSANSGIQSADQGEDAGERY